MTTRESSRHSRIRANNKSANFLSGQNLHSLCRRSSRWGDDKSRLAAKRNSAATDVSWKLKGARTCSWNRESRSWTINRCDIHGSQLVSEIRCTLNNKPSSCLDSTLTPHISTGQVWLPIGQGPQSGRRIFTAHPRTTSVCGLSSRRHFLIKRRFLTVILAITEIIGSSRETVCYIDSSWTIRLCMQTALEPRKPTYPVCNINDTLKVIVNLIHQHWRKISDELGSLHHMIITHEAAHWRLLSWWPQRSEPNDFSSLVIVDHPTRSVAKLIPHCKHNSDNNEKFTTDFHSLQPRRFHGTK